jgi:hypothetical protein
MFRLWLVASLAWIVGIGSLIGPETIKEISSVNSAEYQLDLASPRCKPGTAEEHAKGLYTDADVFG